MSRLIDFALVVFKLLMFKICGIIGSYKYRVFSFFLVLKRLRLAESFLSGRYQCVVLNGQASSGADVKASNPTKAAKGCIL